MKKSVGLVMLVLLIAAGAFANGADDADSAQEMEKIRVAYHANFPGANMAMIMQEEGFFADAGLEVELVKVTSGPPEIAAMVAGDIDLGYLGPGAHLLCINGQAEVIALDSLNYGDEVLALKSSGINSAADLVGKTVGVPKGTSGEMILNLTIEKGGIEQSDVNINNMDVAGSVAAFMAEKIDAIAIWSPYTFEIKKHFGEENVVQLGTNDDFVDQFVFPNSYIATQKYIDENPETVAKFMDAYVAALEYRINDMNAGYGSTVDFVAKYIQAPVDSINQSTGTIRPLTVDEMLDVYTDGTIEKWYQAFGQTFVSNGKIDALPAIETWLNTDLVKEAIERK